MRKTKTDRVDIFNSLKLDRQLPLVAEIRILKEKPTLIYDKLNLFAKPFLSKLGSDTPRMNLPYNQDAKNIKIKKIEVAYFTHDYLVDYSDWPVSFTGSWWWWTHPQLKEFLKREMKVKIYG